MLSKFYLAFQKLWILFALFSITLTVGCDDDDDPVSPHGDHFEAVGVYIKSSGVKLFDYYGPDLSNPNDVLGPLQLNVGDNGHWHFNFYDSNKEIIDGPDDTDKFLVIEIKDTSVVEVWDAHNDISKIVESNGWIQFHFNSGVYEGHMKGISANGDTRMRVKVFHVDHYDFTSPEIQVQVLNQVTTNLAKLFENTTELTVSYLDDSSLNSYYSATFSDTLKLSAAGSKTLEAKFFKATMTETQSGYDIQEGAQFSPPVPVHSLKVISSDENIVSIDQTGLGDWEFKITGNNAGSCNITAYIYHDDLVGKAFHSIPVTVE